MNLGIIFYVISNLFRLLAFLFLFPLGVAIYYQESIKNMLSFIIPIILLILLSNFCSKKATQEENFYSKEGFVIVSLSWILLSLFGALPYFISAEIPSFTDAVFESVSGFTTTGATILINIEKISQSMLFWRSFTHLVGGMGVLVLVLAILPKGNNKSLHIMRAEVPGPTVGKVVAKMSYNSRILYIIYLSMVLILVTFLNFGGMSWFDSFIHAFSTAATGGFNNRNMSVAYYNSAYIEYVLAFGMLLFGLNFNLFYLLILGNFKQVFKSEESKYYLGIILGAVVLICINIYSLYNSFFKMIREVFFTVSSIITTTGFVTADFGKWPIFSKTILIFLMFVGGCAGSTAGGFKVSRVIIIMKKVFIEFLKVGNPNKIMNVKLEGKVVEKDMLEGISSYLMIYVTIFLFIVLLISLDSDNFMKTFSVIATTFNNVGPAFSDTEIISDFAKFSNFSKIIFSVGMLLGRLEILPLLIFFSPRIYKKVS